RASSDIPGHIRFMYFVPEEITVPVAAGMTAPVSPVATALPTLRLNRFLTKKRARKERSPAATGVSTQPAIMPLIVLNFISFTPLIRPMPIIEPTITCEDETGTRGIGGRP